MGVFDRFMSLKSQIAELDIIAKQTIEKRDELRNKLENEFKGVEAICTYEEMIKSPGLYYPYLSGNNANDENGAYLMVISNRRHSSRNILLLCYKAFNEDKITILGLSDDSWATTSKYQFVRLNPSLFNFTLEVSY